jgi:hypothetical protein
MAVPSFLLCEPGVQTNPRADDWQCWPYAENNFSTK